MNNNHRRRLVMPDENNGAHPLATWVAVREYVSAVVGHRRGDDPISQFDVYRLRQALRIFIYPVYLDIPP